MSDAELKNLREQVSEINRRILDLLSQRGNLVMQIGEIKQGRSMETFDPEREAQQLAELVEANPGPYSGSAVKSFFSEIFRASLDMLNKRRDSALRVSRSYQEKDTSFLVGKIEIGKAPLIVAGPVRSRIGKNKFNPWPSPPCGQRSEDIEGRRS